jgi:acyl transferase domain-containing protein
LLETYEEKIDLPNKDSDRNAQNFLKHITKDICKNDGRKKFSSKIECKDIAVIGMSIQCPKAKNTEEFWQNLIQGEDCIKELPEHYLDQKKYFSKEKSSGKTYCKWGGIIEDRYMFDPAFFNISSQEAALLNPHQRLVLLESWRALEDAGYNPKHLANEDVGVFIGAEPLGDYSSSFAGSSEAIIASRLSYFLNLKGPALLVNTGCSSSAVAIHLGCESLRHHESNISVVGGVFAALSGEALVNLSGTDMLSPQGKCRPFDTSSDGTIISEGIGVVVLKRLDDAASAGDSIYGVIKGSGINQDGASNGITAPNGQSQERLITSIYNNFDILAENISYVEAHGTATPLGDAIEVNALVRAFGKLTEKQEFCILGCSKANIGHTMAASGVIGLIRILLSLKYRTIPPQINFHKLSPSIRLEGSAFSIAQEAQNWSSEGNIPLTAALNSFGHSGTNAHLVIQEYTPSYSYDNHVVEPNLDGALLIPLSAKTQESLLLYADRLYKSLEKIFLVAADKHTLSDIAYTLQVGREAMQERVLFSANSISEFKELLAHFIAGNKHENVWMGSVESDEDENREYEGRLQNIETVAKAWISGVNINWLDLYWSDIKPKRAHLPTYPFAIDQFNWISIKNSSTQQQAIYLSEEGLNGSKFDEDSSSRIIKFSSNGSERQLKKKMSANEKAKLFVRFLVAKQLRIEPTDLKENLAIYDLGITSSDIICITKEINKNISPKFMADVFFSCRTTKEITRHLAEHYSTALENIDLSVLLSDKRSSIPQVPNHENADLLLQALKSVKRGSLDIEDVIESIDLGIY